MVLGVLQGKARKDFIFIDLPELSSPSQLEKNQKNNGGEGKAWPHELSALISLLVSGTFSCSGQTNGEITFFPLLFNLSPVFPRGRRSQYLPSWSCASEEESAWTCTPAARGWWVWVLFRDPSSRCALWQEAEHLQFPSKLCKNQLQTWAALATVRGFSCPGEHGRGRESCRGGQHLPDIYPGLHHGYQASFTAVEVGEPCTEPQLLPTTIPHTG